MNRLFGNLDRLLAVIGGLAAGSAAYVAYAADQRVAPVENKLNTHIAVQNSENETVRKVLDRIDKRTLALCQHTPGAVCDE